MQKLKNPGDKPINTVGNRRLAKLLTLRNTKRYSHRNREEKELEEVTSDCFNGRTEKDCENCPANHEYGGPCCFADPDKFAYDKECRSCTYFNDCETEVHTKLSPPASTPRYGFQTRAPSLGQRRNTVINKTKPEWAKEKTGQVSRRPSLLGKDRQRVSMNSLRDKARSKKAAADAVRDEGKKRPASKAEVEQEDQGDTLFQMFYKEASWGAFQGFFEFGSEFFRQHYWGDGR
jgi:hypothetical protein